jgi:hypothetical protein
MAKASAIYPSTTLRVVPLPEQARGGFYCVQSSISIVTQPNR